MLVDLAFKYLAWYFGRDMKSPCTAITVRGESNADSSWAVHHETKYGRERRQLKRAIEIFEKHNISTETLDGMLRELS